MTSRRRHCARHRLRSNVRARRSADFRLSRQTMVVAATDLNRSGRSRSLAVNNKSRPGPPRTQNGRIFPPASSAFSTRRTPAIQTFALREHPADSARREVTSASESTTARPPTARSDRTEFAARRPRRMGASVRAAGPDRTRARRHPRRHSGDRRAEHHRHRRTLATREAPTPPPASPLGRSNTRS